MILMRKTACTCAFAVINHLICNLTRPHFAVRSSRGLVRWRRVPGIWRFFSFLIAGLSSFEPRVNCPTLHSTTISAFCARNVWHVFQQRHAHIATRTHCLFPPCSSLSFACALSLFVSISQYRSPLLSINSRARSSFPFPPPLGPPPTFCRERKRKYCAVHL